LRAASADPILALRGLVIFRALDQRARRSSVLHGWIADITAIGLPFRFLPARAVPFQYRFQPENVHLPNEVPGAGTLLLVHARSFRRAVVHAWQPQNKLWHTQTMFSSLKAVLSRFRADHSRFETGVRQLANQTLYFDLKALPFRP